MNMPQGEKIPEEWKKVVWYQTPRMRDECKAVAREMKQMSQKKTQVVGKRSRMENYLLILLLTYPYCSEYTVEIN